MSRSTTLTPEQQEKKEARKAKFRGLVKQIADMTDEQRAAISAKMFGVLTCEGRSLSGNNSCMVFLQCPHATIVGGFRQWLAQGRCVRKGESSIMIWIPCGKKDAEGNTMMSDDKHFVIGSIFDVSQTEPVE